MHCTTAASLEMSDEPILFMKSSEIELDSLVSMNFPFLGERGNDAK